MKQKTASLIVYRPFGGAQSARCISVEYRRKCLVSFDGDNSYDLKDKAAVWAYNQGFTKINFKDITGAEG